MTDPAPSLPTLPAVEFWFEFGSASSYLGVMRVEDEARRLGVRVVWKRFLLGPIFRALGLENSPFVLQKEKGAYLQQDMARLCRKYRLAPWRTPSVFPRLGVLPLRIVLLGVHDPRPAVGGLMRHFPTPGTNIVQDRILARPKRFELLTPQDS
jgi:2-hydroxychromene-2-carboxylate isomerase